MSVSGIKLYNTWVFGWALKYRTFHYTFQYGFSQIWWVGNNCHCSLHLVVILAYTCLLVTWSLMRCGACFGSTSFPSFVLFFRALSFESPWFTFMPIVYVCFGCLCMSVWTNKYLIRKCLYEPSISISVLRWTHKYLIMKRVYQCVAIGIKLGFVWSHKYLIRQSVCICVNSRYQADLCVCQCEVIHIWSDRVCVYQYEVKYLIRQSVCINVNL